MILGIGLLISQCEDRIDVDPIEDEVSVCILPLEILAEPVGGSGEFAQRVEKSFKYPYRLQCFEGRVFVTLIVESNGATTGYDVIKGVDQKIDEAAITAVRIASETGWKPGTLGGIAARQRFVVPVDIRPTTPIKD